jgi:hypothetical protein
MTRIILRAALLCLLAHIPIVCVDTVSGINGPRPIMGHTNDVHNLMVHDNVFVRMGRSAIELNNGKNDPDGNVYGTSDNPRFMQPFCASSFPSRRSGTTWNPGASSAAGTRTAPWRE